ncbi:MAG: 3'-5' exonuclease [Spirochaetaceae bacterium]|nr:3'-5' exonuclease [Spirochaetaceae bacterium]
MPQTDKMLEIQDLLQMYDSGAVFTAFDTETTGLNPEEEKILEIGAVSFDRLGIRARYNVLINPQRKILPEITRVNGIDDAMVSGKPVFAENAGHFLDFIKGSVLIAHNAPFDLGFVNTELSRINMPPLQNETADTLKLSRDMLPDLGKYNLQFLAKYFEINVVNAHRAEDDARVCMEVFLKLLDKIRPPKPEPTEPPPEQAQPNQQ